MTHSEAWGATYAIPGEGGSFFCEFCQHAEDGIRLPGYSDEEAAAIRLQEHWDDLQHPPGNPHPD